MLAENDVVWPEWLKPSAKERAAAPPPRWSDSSAPTRLPSAVVPNRLLQLAETLHDEQTRSRNSPDASSIFATACDAATVTSQRKPMVQMLTGAGKLAFTTVPAGAVTLRQRLTPSFQSMSPWQMKV